MENLFQIRMKIFFLLCTGLSYISCEEDTLRLVNILYRHGNRTPTDLFPTDNNTESTWAEGLGELTKGGIRQAYELGEFLRERYLKGSFMNASFRHDEIYVQSADVNRCLMSAQAVLSGMYPPSGEQQWNAETNWQPIPVHTVPAVYDQVFSKAPCPKLIELNTTAASKEDYEFVKKNYGAFIADIHEKAGFKWSMNSSDLFGHSMAIWGALSIEKQLGRYTPPWANDTVMDKLHDELRPLQVYLGFKNREILRLRGGAMLHKVITDMKMRKEGILDANMKMFMYSGHDSTIRPFLAILHALSNRTIPYCTTVMLELHQHPPGDKHPHRNEYFVQLWLRKDGHLEQLDIPGCGKDCDFDLFIYATKSMVVEDRYRECQLRYWYERFTTYRGVLLAACIAGGLAGLLLLVVCLTYCCRRCRRARIPLPRKYHVCETGLPEELPMINTALSDED